MRKNIKKRARLAGISVVIVCLLFVASLQLTGIINLFGEDDYGTGMSADTTTVFVESEKPYPYDSTWEGKLFLKGDDGTSGQEIFTKPKYIVAWQGSTEDSQLITARTDFLYHGCRRCEGWFCAFGYIVGSLLGRYWMTVDYIAPSGTTTNIIDTKNNNYKTDWITLARQFSSNFVSGSGHQLPNANYITEDYNGLGTDQWHAPWTEKDGQAQWYSMGTETLEFNMRGARMGVLEIKTEIRAANRENKGWADWWFHPDDYIIAQDECYLASGEGEVIITSTNSVSSDGTATTDETNKVYTKYVYEEGGTVKMQVDAGYSGASLDPEDPGYGRGWTLTIYDSTGSSRYSKNIPDDRRGYPVSYTVPTGAWIPNDPNDNEWRVVLSNTLFDQSETRLFVIDKYENMPGQAIVSTDKTSYVQGETVQVTVEAYSNELTGQAISHFQAWAKYDSYGSVVYASPPRDYTAYPVSGRLYRASFSFQLSPDLIHGNRNVYIRAHAIDAEGRAGPENEDCIIFAQQVAGTYQITVIVTDTSGAPIRSAFVKFEGDSSITTDPNGVAILYKDFGTYTLVVSKPEYSTHTQSGIAIHSDISISVTLSRGFFGDYLLLIIGIIIAIIVIIVTLYYLRKTRRGSSKGKPSKKRKK